MHRWFFANDELICIKPPEEPPHIPTPKAPTPPPEIIQYTLWTFQVRYRGRLCSNESLAVTGNISALGNWKVNNCILLTKSPEANDLWTIEIDLPRNQNIRYRYLICATNGRGQKIVRFWECQKFARIIKTDDEQNLDSMNCDIFGGCKRETIHRGWLNRHTMVVQLKFYKAPFISRELVPSPLINIKVTLMRLTVEKKTEKPKNTVRNEEEIVDEADESEMPTEDQSFKLPFAFCEVATLREQNGEFRYQPKYGTPCGPNDHLMFHLTLGDFEATAYLIDLYRYPPKASDKVPPYHYGYLYVYPQQLKKSHGRLKLNVMCATKHRPIGTIEFEYLQIKHLEGHVFNMKNCLQVPQAKKETGILLVGHRGCGKSFWNDLEILRENTLNSFTEAFEHGVDIVEFDVHLTKDKIPVIYHDYQLYISRKVGLSNEEYDILYLPLDKNEINNFKSLGRILKSGLIALPLSKFTLEQLQRVKVYNEEPREGPQYETCIKDKSTNLPFVTLEKALSTMNAKLGFSIEIKYSQEYDNGRWEENYINNFDKNEYVDIVLNVVLNNSSSRPIYFSSFDADICSILRLKQNRFPVVFLCRAQSAEPKFLDPRCNDLHLCTYFAHAMELYAIVAHSDDIINVKYEIPSIHAHFLRVFTWGNDGREEEFRHKLRALGVDGVLYDRANKITNVPDLKHNVVLIELLERKEEECKKQNNTMEEETMEKRSTVKGKRRSSKK